MRYIDLEGRTHKVLTCHFRASLKHKDDGQKKFIKLNSPWSNIKLEGQMNSEFDELKPKSSNLEL